MIMSDQEIQKAAEELFKDSEYPVPNIYCFTKGAKWALSHQWISVEERLPEDSRNTQVLVKTRKGSISGPYTVCFFSEGKFHNSRSVDIPVIAWMPIPSLSDTNTKKQC